MTKTIQCEIVSAEGSVYSGSAEQVVAAGILGDLGILAGHTPLLTELAPGPVRVLNEGREENYYVSGGFIEVQPEKVIVLADTAVRASDLDEASAEEARKQALKAMEDKSAEMDYTRAAAELSEAMAQLRTIQQLRRKAGKS
ncbi:F0F1 ATP synthase subunit epsilon [Halomonas denitrificans]|uniref:F0F1 ATP synthase subunit epsilon n=1 Tax=Halomonas TaxID=2745 RepID=UPI001A8CB483|nr:MULTISPECIES: F0F1 ATP synthase subunit epsilon [Halomonas]MED5295984.1 F0F1 ATP synthase subunit epsilon [Pseudomonadota bacterium]MBN8412778.1 F0F1 ATP synthase subunit epsilon [Halomonas litopenaei]MBY5925073.1 F0F1 ATP synthase subunit epsilon [Halomonas sp. DP4Y7-2]MBY5928868.1 F0F1 ATP synthase subunit epsilon [Halomonas sp. DP8Y7-3]MBY5967990.1 F0F1 ATP synthase subunit epsilon [Halomonas denitrificans]